MRLLFAEDEKELSNAVSAILRHNNYSVDTVYNGIDAIDYLELGEYDGVILDIMMPGADGLTVLKKIRAAGNNVPALLLTAKSEIHDKVFGLDCGADDYLTKPFVAKELLARIRAMLRRRGGTAESTVKTGNISLDKNSFELIGPLGSVKLANKEYQMAEMFMENPGRVISAERFLEKIWGFDSDTEQNTVWVYISNLRKKLAKIGSNAQIKVSRNVGYFMEAGTDD